MELTASLLEDRCWARKGCETGDEVCAAEVNGNECSDSKSCRDVVDLMWKENVLIDCSEMDEWNESEQKSVIFLNVERPRVRSFNATWHFGGKGLARPLFFSRMQLFAT